MFSNLDADSKISLFDEVIVKIEEENDEYETKSIQSKNEIKMVVN